MSIFVDREQEEKSIHPLEFAWLEITPSCQLACVHCYRESMPGLGHGQLNVDDWMHLIVSLRALGTRFVQFIGGEPTIYPGFCELLAFTAEAGLSVEVYSNLVSITPRMWELFSQYHIRIATSFYSDNSVIHDSITGVSGSYQKTLTNIRKVLALNVPFRVGIVHMREDQDIASTKAMLADLGIKRIGVDRARGVGRGVQFVHEDPISALCGKCVKNRCVITADGEVYPCIMSRSFPVGNVLKHDIASVVTGTRMQETIALLSEVFAARFSTDCGPDDQDCDPECDPQDWPPCSPDCCPETVASCEPSEDDDE